MGDVLRLFDDHGECDALTLFDAGPKTGKRSTGSTGRDDEAEQATVLELNVWADRVAEVNQLLGE